MSEQPTPDFGELMGENIRLKEQLARSNMLAEMVIHYLCVQGADDWPRPDRLDLIQNTYLESQAGIMR